MISTYQHTAAVEESAMCPNYANIVAIMAAVRPQLNLGQARICAGGHTTTKITVVTEYVH